MNNECMSLCWARIFDFQKSHCTIIDDIIPTNNCFDTVFIPVNATLDIARPGNIHDNLDSLEFTTIYYDFAGKFNFSILQFFAHIATRCMINSKSPQGRISISESHTRGIAKIPQGI